MRKYKCFSCFSIWDFFSNRGEGSLHLPLKADASSNKYENSSFLLYFCPVLLVCSCLSFFHCATAFVISNSSLFSLKYSSYYDHYVTLTIIAVLLFYLFIYPKTKNLSHNTRFKVKHNLIEL